MFPPIPEGDLPDRRTSREQPHHVGLVVSQRRAIEVARKLFPGEVADGSDCSPGFPCRICAERNAEWAARVRAVRQAMIEAFSW